MAEGDENSAPQTLAGLWLKSRPSRPSQPAAAHDIESGDPQMGLLFAAPAAVDSAPAPRARRKAASRTGPATPTKTRRRAAPAAPPATPAPPERRIWSVRDLVTGIRNQVEREYADLWVEGEISNCRPAPSGREAPRPRSEFPPQRVRAR